jgi:hypothetical protein
MSERGGRKNSGRGGRGRGGRGRGGRGGRGRGRGQNYTGAANASKNAPKRGLCAALGINVFDCGQKSAADQMRTSWENVVVYVGTIYGQDISKELENKVTVTLVEPVHTIEVLTRHGVREQMIRKGQTNIQQARRAYQAILQTAVNAGLDLDAPIKLANLQNEIAQGEVAANVDVPVVLTDSEEIQFRNEWLTYRERNANLIKHRGEAFSLIRGQCTQLLQDKMKQDTDWNTVSTSCDPLTLYRLIEKTVSAQTEDQYLYATVYDQELAFYSMKQENLSNSQWYERFNTKVDAGDAVGVTRQHKVLLEYVAQELHTQAFADLGAAEQQIVREDAEERYASYAFLRQSGKQHDNLKVDLENYFTIGDNRYPNNRQQTLHLLDKYSKTVVAKATQSEGTSFVQGGDRDGSDDKRNESKTFDKSWGENIAALKGKTTRSKTNPVARDYVQVPTEFLKLHKEVFLTFDLFFVNKIPFFLTLSRKICFTAVNHLADSTVPQIFKAFKEIYQYYLQRGFRITTVHADGEFAPIKTLIESLSGGPMVNLASANEHVPEIEQRIRVVKEKCRANRHALPFQRIPKLLTIHIVLNVVNVLNYFPAKGGVSETLSPRTIMSGEPLDYNKHLSLHVGQYCQVHEEENPRNSQIARTKGAICLGPSGNLQGGFKFMALNTGKKIVRRSWDVIPIPDVVIARVNALGSDQPEQL